MVLIGIGMGSVYAVMALGFHIVFQATEVFNFAHGELAVLGGLLAYSLMVKLHVTLWLTFILIVLAGFVVGIIFERIAIRSIDSQMHLSIIVSTIAMGIIIQNGDLLIWGKDELPFPTFSTNSTITILGSPIPSQYLWVFSLSMLIILAVGAFFRFTLTGKAIRATALNRIGVLGVGINPLRMVAFSYGLSVSLAMLAGMVIAPLTSAGGLVGVMLTVKGFTAAILGGITRMPSVVLGGFLLGLVEALTAGLISSDFRDPIALGTLLLIFMFQPRGIFARLGAGKGGEQWRKV